MKLIPKPINHLSMYLLRVEIWQFASEASMPPMIKCKKAN